MQRGTISTYESAVDLVVEWKIENFFNLLETDGKIYWSSNFSYGGEEWSLWIFPNGWGGNYSSGHVDLRLWKCGNSPSIKETFSLSLKTAKGEKYNEHNVTKDFGIYPENYHEFLRFTPRSELTRRRSELVPEGVLTVVCTMKNSTSAGNTNNIASASVECCHCKGTFNADSLSSHQKICMHRPVKCPDCFEVVVLQKWFNEHECQQERPEAGNDPEHAYVGASTQRVGASTQHVVAPTQRVGASTQHVVAPTQRLVGSTQYVVASTQRVVASTQHVGASTRRLRASTQRVGASTQTVERFTQTVEEKYETAASGSSTNSQEKKALLDFKELFLKKEDCDVTIKVKSSEFPAHRVILKARSPVLASTFRHDMKERATGVLEIDDCDSSSFSDFLCFLYCADVTLITQKSVFDLFTLADKYQVLDLRSKCLEFMKNNLTVDTFCETLTLALRYSETDLIKLSTDYFKNNVPKIIVTVKWQTFLAENPTEGNELFVKYFVPNSS